MNWIRLPLKLARVSDIEREEDLGIDAPESDGQIYIRVGEITHFLGAESPTTIWVRGEDEPYVVDLPVEDVYMLITQVENEFNTQI